MLLTRSAADHIINNVTEAAGSNLRAEPLNDANGVFQYKGSWQPVVGRSFRSPSFERAKALKAMAEALPAGWDTKTSRSTGSTYYVNLATGESTYELPTAPAEPRAEAIE